MARLRADARNAGDLPAGRDAVWALVRAQREFTINSITNALRARQGFNRSSVKTYVQGLARAGYLEEAGAVTCPGQGARRPEKRYRLVRDVGVEAPRVTRSGRAVTQGSATEQMWRALRIIMSSSFTYRDLAVHASTDECVVNEAHAKSYLHYLHKAGYVHEVVPGNPHHLARYRFLSSRNTGPQPPQVQRIKQVWDPNINQVVWPPKGDG